MVISSRNTVSEGSFVPLDIEYENGIITALRPYGTSEHIDADYGDDPIYPGFIDIHTHGGDMIDVNHLTCYEDADRLSRFYAAHGVTSFTPSVMTDTREQTEKLLLILKEAIERGVSGATIEGIHLEGPFLAMEYKGAMPDYLIRNGDPQLFDHYQEVSGGHVIYITVAPEIEGGMELIRHIRKKGGVTIAMGHSAAEYETAVEAVKCGVTASTHLFNAMKLFHMHRPAISGASLTEDEVYTEIISDGFHLHPATVRLVLKTKGLNKVVAISDSIMAAGLPDGNYQLGVNPVVVKDGDAKLLNGVRAGSTLTLERALRKLIEFTGLSGAELSPVLSLNQARLLSLGNKGEIRQGAEASFAVLDKDGAVRETIVKGKSVYKKEETR